ncbi:GLUG motif-containing protein [Burkholderia sp. PU8-34]
MNHVYRLVWSGYQDAYVPASETARGRSKSAGARALSAAVLLSLSVTAHGLPTGGQVSAGQGSIAQSGPAMTINQSSPNLSINWNTFGIGATESVTFVQPNSSAIALNRVLGTETSQIYGRLAANGQVWLLNPNGILFGVGAQVNVGGLLASTLNLSDADFLAGKRIFTGNGGTVVNQGTLSVSDGGYVAMLGGHVSNEGVIQARLGTVALGAGNQISLDFAGDKLLNLQVDQGAVSALAQNKQLIQANGGTVLLTAKAADALLNTVVNNEGVIEAQTIDTHSGTIKLLGGGGTVTVDGTLDASAPNGGNGGAIETSGEHLKVADSARITTAAPYGQTGQWLIDPTDYTIAASGGDMTGANLSQQLQSNNVTIVSSSGATAGNGDINVNDTVSWAANTGLTLSAYRNINVNANITATGNTAGLTLTPNTGNLGGVYSLNNGSTITLSGLTPSLIIAGRSYTVINSLDALQSMQNGPSSNYALGSNIDASATATWNGGAGFAPVGNYPNEFSGIFDGLGHVVRNLTINRPSQYYVGLFGFSVGTVTNVGMANASVVGYDSVGGLVGYNVFGTVSNAYATGSVSGTTSVGGLVGFNSTTMSNVYATASVSGTASVGGLVGGSNGAVSNAYATGSVSGTTSVGGLAGTSVGTVSNAYATGPVSGTTSVGGLAGTNAGTVTNAYATGSVSGTTAVGGLVGYNSGGTVTNAYWDTTTTGQTTSAGGTGLTTDQMMQPANLAGFDFTNTWWMSAGNTRPFLRSEYSTSISNAHQLQLMAMNPAASYTLAGDIDMSELTRPSGMWNVATGFVPIGDQTTPFSGTFNGAGHAVNDLVINRPSQNYVGLFGYSSGTVMNVGIANGVVTGGNYVGGLLGINEGTVTNAYATGSVSGGSSSEDIGGLVGVNGGTMGKVYATASVSGGSAVGGLVGWSSDPGTVSDAYATGSVSGTSYVGGLVGFNYGTGAVSNSYATGSVNGNIRVGGLIGENWGAVTDVYATGSVSGASYVGGLIGFTFTSNTQVRDAYATGSVSGTSYVGGLVGANYGGIVSNAYATGSVNGGSNSQNVGGLVGYNDYTGTVSNAYWDTATTGQTTSAGGVGLTDAQMTQQSSFAGFDFTNTWRIYNGYTYPLLKSFLVPLTVTANNATKTYDTTSYTGGNGVTLSNANASLSGTLSYTGSAQGARNAGSYLISPSGLWSTTYDISYVNGTLTINPAQLTIAATTDNRIYNGTTSSTATPTVSGLLGSDSVAGLTQAFGSKNVLGTGGSTLNVTGYTINDGNGGGNYAVQTQSTAGTITPALLTLSTNNVVKTYDGTTGANGTAIVTAGTLFGGDSLSGGSFAFTDKNAGTNKTVTVNGVTVNDGNSGGNYQVSYANNTTSTINQALLTVTANNASKTYDGTAYSGGNGVTYLGFVNGETASVLGGTLTYGGSSQGATNAGSYSINPTGYVSNNYAISYGNGTLTVNPKALTASISGTTSKVYNGDGAATITNGRYVLSGFVGSQSATINQKIGSYNSKNVDEATTVTASLASANYTAGAGTLLANYILPTSASGAGKITPATLTYVANQSSMLQGSAIPTLSGYVTGFVANETLTSATSGTAVWTTTATSSSSAGQYPINGSGLTANHNNYAFVQARSNATALTITCVSTNKNKCH